MKTLNDFLRMKKTGEKIVMLTAYDYPSARLAQEGVDVGDAQAGIGDGEAQADVGGEGVVGR